MNNLRSLIWAFGAFVLCGCAVISSDVTDEALPVPDFVELTRQAERYRGETVVLGGYVLSVENLEDHTRIIALEAPLGTGQRPKSKDLSRGRLHLLYDGFLDPEVYTRDRQITVGGRILEPIAQEPPPYPYLRIQVSELHLWPIEKPVPADPYWDDPWCAYPWWYFPWRHRRWCD